MCTTDWRSAGGTLLSVQVTEAVEAVGKVFTRGEALARELLLAAGAQEAVLVPRLVMVGHASSGDGLEEKTMNTFQYAFPRSSVCFQPIVSFCKIVYQKLILDIGVLHSLSSCCLEEFPEFTAFKVYYHLYRGVINLNEKPP